MLSWIRTSQSRSRTFLFLDRDGVINVDRPDYVKRWAEFQFYSDALESFRWLHQRGVEIILISNQSALNRGIMTWEDFWELHDRMVAAIREAGGDLLGAFYCPHRPDEGCSCRKPARGLIWAAAEIFGVPLSTTYLIGNRGSDISAAANAGCRGILLDRHEEITESIEGCTTTAAYKRYTSLCEAIGALYE